MYCEGGGLSEKGPFLALPPGKRLTLGVGAPAYLVPPVSWARFLWRGLRSRRLTEPPRPSSAKDEVGSLEHPFPAGEGSEPRMSAAALSAAVDSTTFKRTAPNSQGRPVCRSVPLHPQLLFGRGVRGRRFSQRSGLPRSLPHLSLPCFGAVVRFLCSTLVSGSSCDTMETNGERPGEDVFLYERFATSTLCRPAAGMGNGSRLRSRPSC